MKDTAQPNTPARVPSPFPPEPRAPGRESALPVSRSRQAKEHLFPSGSDSSGPLPSPAPPRPASLRKHGRGKSARRSGDVFCYPRRVPPEAVRAARRFLRAYARTGKAFLGPLPSLPPGSVTRSWSAFFLIREFLDREGCPRPVRGVLFGRYFLGRPLSRVAADLSLSRRETSLWEYYGVCAVAEALYVRRKR